MIGYVAKCDYVHCREEAVLSEDRVPMLPDGWLTGRMPLERDEPVEEVHFCCGDHAMMHNFNLTRETETA